MIETSKRALLAVAGLWVLMLSPVLCTGGIMEHLCIDCDDAACGHEDACLDDPCPDDLALSGGRAGDATPGTVNPLRLAGTSNVLPTRPMVPTRHDDRPDRANVPRPDSDLPLLS